MNSSILTTLVAVLFGAACYLCLWGLTRDGGASNDATLPTRLQLAPMPPNGAGATAASGTASLHADDAGGPTEADRERLRRLFVDPLPPAESGEAVGAARDEAPAPPPEPAAGSVQEPVDGPTSDQSVRSVDYDSLKDRLERVGDALERLNRGFAEHAKAREPVEDGAPESSNDIMPDRRDAGATPQDGP